MISINYTINSTFALLLGLAKEISLLIPSFLRGQIKASFGQKYCLSSEPPYVSLPTSR